MTIKVLNPIAIGSADAWNFGVGADKVAAVAVGDPPVPDFFDFIQTGAVAVQQYLTDKTFSEQMTTVNSVTIYFYSRAILLIPVPQITVKIVDSLGTHTSAGQVQTGPWALYSITRTVMSDGVTPWSESALRDGAFEIGLGISVANWVRAAALWAEVDYIASPVSLATTFPRLTTSQMIHEFMMRHGFMDVNLPISALNLRMMDHFFLSHPEGPHPNGEGWKDLEWERRLFRNFGLQFDPDGDLDSVRAFALDLRKYITYLRDTAVSPYSIQSDETDVDGPLRLDLGITRTMTRGTTATAEDISGEVVQLTTNTERIGPDGILIEDYRKNFAKESAFKTWSGGAAAAPDNYTEVDADANLTIARVANGVFAANLSTYGCQLTSANAAGGDYGLDQATSFAWEEDDNGVLSIDHEDHSGQALVVGLQRSDTSEWWNPATGAWQAGAASLSFPIAPAGTIVRDHMAFDLGGTTNFTGTFLIYIRIPSASQDCTLHSVQLEGGSVSEYECGLWYPTSRIITASASAIPRDRDDLQLSTNPTQRRIIHPDHGTLFLKIKVPYTKAELDDADMATARRVAILEVNMFTAEDFFILYNTVTTRFNFIYRVGSTATFYDLFTSDEYVIAVRWTSDKGELNLTPYTQDIFVNGVKGVSDIGTVRTEDNATKYCYYGAFRSPYIGAAYNSLNGFISRLHSTPEVLTDEEIKAWSDRMA